ncbi:MAG TPA: hypothetical protein PLK16_12585 [Saprospiraceae bacterium]|nr:hypothetical protein [Saprospiraceae bacterium]
MLFMLGSLSLFAVDCNIGQLNVDILPCGNDGKFYVKVNFSYQNVGNEGFKIVGNGNNYGTFQYNQLPVTIGPFVGNGTSEYEIVVKDIQFPDCQNFKEFGPVQCNSCSIYDLVVDTGNCTSDSTYSATVNFEYQNVGNNGFKLFFNGVLFGTYQYTQLPLNIQNFPVSNKKNDVVKIIDVDNPDCYKAVEYEGLKCGSQGGDCIITNLTAVESDCDSAGNFYVTIDFDFENEGNQGFTILGNGVNYGNFEYGNLPVVLGPLKGSKDKVWEFIVKDKQYSYCLKGISIGKKDCGTDCEIYEVVVTKGDCTSDSTYVLTIDFDYKNVGGDKFNLKANGKYFGTYLYTQLPLTINNFPKSGQGVDWILICDKENEQCCKGKEFETKSCGNSGDCIITNLTAVASDCDSAGNFYVTIDFDYENEGNQGFTILGNGVNYGNFEYGNLPVVLGPLKGSKDKVWEFIVKDKQYSYCLKGISIGKKDCGTDCEIYEVVVTKGDCTSDSTYVLTIDFDYKNVGGDKFNLKANGKYFGTYLYTQLPLTINNFPKSGQGVDWILICDKENEQCCKGKEFETKSCGNSGDCIITNLTAVASDCDSAGNFYVTIDFDYENEGNQGFTIQGNGVNYGNFGYADLPVVLGPFKGSNTKVWEFKVKDIQYPDCYKVKELGKVDCGDECEIKNLVVDLGNCTSDSTYSIYINFAVEKPGSTHFKLFANGQYFGTFAYDSLPLNLSDFPQSGNTHDWLKVCDNEKEDCCKTKEFKSPKCGGNIANIYNLNAKIVNCVNGVFNVELSFKHHSTGTKGYRVSGNGKQYGVFDYSQNPLVLGPIVNDTKLQYEFVVTDNEFNTGDDYVNIGYVDCTTATHEPAIKEAGVSWHFVGTDLIISTKDKERIIQRISMFNYLGQAVMRTEVNSTTTSINTCALHPGMYVCLVTFADGHQSVLIPKLD